MELTRLFGIVMLLAQLPRSFQVNYDIAFNENNFVESCNDRDNEGNLALSDIVDISDLKLSEGADAESINLSGSIKMKLDVPENEHIKIEMEVMRLKRGVWQPTIYSLRRADLCQAMADPHEIWHGIVMSIPEEERECPPKAGKTYNMQNFSNHVLLENLPRMKLEGDLKTVVHLSVASYKTCMVFYTSVYKV